MPVTVNFMGICTFVTPQGIPGLDVPFRVVLVNASNGATISGVVIPPHNATIQVGSQPAQPLSGVTVSVTMSGTQTPPNAPDFQNSIPNLTNMVDPIAPISTPSEQIVLGEIPQFVAAYVDIVTGTLTGAIVDGTAQSTLVVGEGAPAGTTFALTMQSFGSQSVTTTPLDPDATITISNQATPAEEQISPEGHFLLHYQVAAQMPPAPQTPEPPDIGHGLPGTIGCSNSTYP